MSIIPVSEIVKQPFDGINWLEKATPNGKVTLDEITDALEEFARLFTAGISSKAETLTLARAFPSNRQYTEAASHIGDEDPMVVGGPASVSLIDREGHLITTDALKRAFKKFMANFRTRNAMVLHSDVQVGWALPAYITRGGTIFRSGVDDSGLFFICELRDDTKIADKVKEQIKDGRLKSYSIAGSAIKVQNMTKGLMPYMQVDDMELAEVTVCEKGVNQGAGFELLKAEMPQTGKIDKDQCDYRNASPEETMRGINCGHCKFFNAQDKTCDTVNGDIQPGDWCKIFAPMEQQPKHAKVVLVMRNKQNVDFKKSFDMWMQKESKKDPLKGGESFATLENFAGREAEHQQLLREFGFPSGQPAESSRYVPVVETETNDKGVPRNLKPPWLVNEAGQDLGDRLDEDAPDYNKSDKAKARKKAGSAQKMFMGFMNKQNPSRELDAAILQQRHQEGRSWKGAENISTDMRTPEEQKRFAHLTSEDSPSYSTLPGSKGYAKPSAPQTAPPRPPHWPYASEGDKQNAAIRAATLQQRHQEGRSWKGAENTPTDMRTPAEKQIQKMDFLFKAPKPHERGESDRVRPTPERPQGSTRPSSRRSLETPRRGGLAGIAQRRAEEPSAGVGPGEGDKPFGGWKPHHKGYEERQSDSNPNFSNPRGGRGQTRRPDAGRFAGIPGSDKVGEAFDSTIDAIGSKIGSGAGKIGRGLGRAKRELPGRLAEIAANTPGVSARDVARGIPSAAKAGLIDPMTAASRGFQSGVEGKRRGAKEGLETKYGRGAGEVVRQGLRGARGAFRGFFKPGSPLTTEGKGGEQGVGAGTERLTQRGGEIARKWAGSGVRGVKGFGEGLAGEGGDDPRARRYTPEDKPFGGQQTDVSGLRGKRGGIGTRKYFRGLTRGLAPGAKGREYAQRTEEEGEHGAEGVGYGMGVGMRGAGRQAGNVATAGVRGGKYAGKKTLSGGKYAAGKTYGGVKGTLGGASRAGGGLLSRLASSYGESVGKHREARRLSGSIVQPGGPTPMRYDDHMTHLNNHLDHVMTHGHDTHGGFLEGLARTGLTPDGQRMFSVQQGPKSAYATGKVQHASDFVKDLKAGHIKIKVHKDFEHLKDEIHSQIINPYSEHLNSAPGRGNEAGVRASAGQINARIQAPRPTAPPVGQTGGSVAGPAPSTASPSAPNVMPTHPLAQQIAAQRNAPPTGNAPTPPPKKPVDPMMASIDKMLLKAFGTGKRNERLLTSGLV